MCGIAGILNLGNDEPIGEREMRRMLATIRNRGPDEFGIYLDHQVAMGSARLSIIDLSNGQQPISNEDGSLWIVFNGEIFNYVELRQELDVELKELTQRLRKDDFHLRAADLNSTLTHIRSSVRDAATRLGQRQKVRIQEGIEDLQRLPEWGDLTQEERGNAVDRLERLTVESTADMNGLKALLAAEYNITFNLSEISAHESSRDTSSHRDSAHVSMGSGGPDHRSARPTTSR